MTEDEVHDTGPDEIGGVTRHGRDLLAGRGYGCGNEQIGPCVPWPTMAQVSDNLSGLERQIRELHFGRMPLGGHANCQECAKPWPCPTLRLLDD